MAGARWIEEKREREREREREGGKGVGRGGGGGRESCRVGLGTPEVARTGRSGADCLVVGGFNADLHLRSSSAQGACCLPLASAEPQGLGVGESLMLASAVLDW